MRRRDRTGDESEKPELSDRMPAPVRAQAGTATASMTHSEQADYRGDRRTSDLALFCPALSAAAQSVARLGDGAANLRWVGLGRRDSVTCLAWGNANQNCSENRDIV